MEPYPAEYLKAVSETEEPPKSVWRRVTPFSKYTALLLFVTMPFIGGWVGHQYAPEKVVEVDRVVTAEKVNNYFPRYMDDKAMQESTDVENFTGSYYTETRTAFGKTEECNLLYVRGYPENDLHNYFVKLALDGNTVQQFGESGLYINLPWEEIPEADKEVIKSSISSKPSTYVTLRLQKNAGGKPREVNTCFSFVSYLGLIK